MSTGKYFLFSSLATPKGNAELLQKLRRKKPLNCHCLEASESPPEFGAQPHPATHSTKADPPPLKGFQSDAILFEKKSDATKYFNYLRILLPQVSKKGWSLIR